MNMSECEVITSESMMITSESMMITSENVCFRVKSSDFLVKYYVLCVNTSEYGSFSSECMK